MLSTKYLCNSRKIRIPADQSTPKCLPLAPLAAWYPSQGAVADETTNKQKLESSVIENTINKQLLIANQELIDSDSSFLFNCIKLSKFEVLQLPFPAFLGYASRGAETAAEIHWPLSLHNLKNFESPKSPLIPQTFRYSVRARPGTPKHPKTRGPLVFAGCVPARAQWSLAWRLFVGYCCW